MSLSSTTNSADTVECSQAKSSPWQDAQGWGLPTQVFRTSDSLASQLNPEDQIAQIKLSWNRWATPSQTLSSNPHSTQASMSRVLPKNKVGYADFKHTMDSLKNAADEVWTMDKLQKKIFPIYLTPQPEWRNIVFKMY